MRSLLFFCRIGNSGVQSTSPCKPHPTPRGHQHSPLRHRRRIPPLVRHQALGQACPHHCRVRGSPRLDREQLHRVQGLVVVPVVGVHRCDPHGSIRCETRPSGPSLTPSRSAHQFCAASCFVLSCQVASSSPPRMVGRERASCFTPSAAACRCAGGRRGSVRQDLGAENGRSQHRAARVTHWVGILTVWAL